MLETVKRSDAATGFTVLPRHRVAERSFAWFGRNRRFAKNFKTAIATTQT